MKNVKTLIMFILVLLFSLTLVNAKVQEFEFEIEIDYDFEDEDEEIECDITIDKNTDDESEKTWTLDENDDTTYTNDMIKELEFDCDEDLKKIEVKIYDDQGVKVDEFEYKNQDKFDYELDPVDEEKEWFEIEIENDFDNDEEIDCELTIDGRSYDFTFDEDSEDDDELEIRRNFKEDVEFECDENLDNIEFRAYDDNEDELYYNDYDDEDKFSFNIDDTEPKHEIRITLKDITEETTCDLRIDKDDTDEFTFDENTESDDLRITREFKKELEFDCDEKIEEIALRIYNPEGDKIDEEFYDDEDEFEYKLNTGKYAFLIQISDDFEKDVDCTLYADGDDVDDYELTSGSRLGDLLIDAEFDEDFSFRCDENIEHFKVTIFNDTDESDDEIHNFELKNTDIVNFNIDELEDKKVEEKYEEIIEEEVKEEENKSEEEVVKEVPLENVTGEANNNNQQGQIDNTNNLENNLTTTPIEKVNETTTPIEEDSSNSKLILGLVIIVLTVLIIFFYMKLRTLANTPKSRRKEKVDFGFLKSKK